MEVLIRRGDDVVIKIFNGKDVLGKEEAEDQVQAQIKFWREALAGCRLHFVITNGTDTGVHAVYRRDSGPSHTIDNANGHIDLVDPRKSWGWREGGPVK